MVTTRTSRSIWLPGLRALAVFSLMLGTVPAASAQAGSDPPVASQPVPSGIELAKLIWSTMAAIDHANQSGNYSVLRDISSPGFQLQNNAAQLSEVFRGVRESRIDLANTLLLAPSYSGAPQLLQADVFRVQGYFGLRPTAISFDLVYQWVQGRWRLYGVSIGSETLARIQPEGAE